MDLRRLGGERSQSRRHRTSSVISLTGLVNHKQKKAKNTEVKRMFRFIRFTQLLCVVYIVTISFAHEPIGMLREDNTIRDRETVIATSPLHLVCLGISRISAYSMYPAMVLVFLSKAKALQTWLEGTVLSIFIPFYDLHSVHEAMGTWIAVDVWIHAFFHTVRWADQGKLNLYWETDTGRSGFIVLAITPFIAFPMMFDFFKRRMSFELRKGLHYLCVPFGIGICFHAPVMHIGWIMGITTGIYLADYAVRWLFMTHKIKSSHFVRLDTGIQLTFQNPKNGFATNGGYILLNVPFVNRSEWHAFSVFAHPVLPDHSCVCVAKSGDWTAALHHAVQRPTVRPTWIQGPFPSPFKTTEDFDNLVLVASGVGITPAMAAINRFQDDGRKYNLVWACRDASLIEFYAHSISLETTGWVLIYYTGSRPLKFSDDARRLPPTVRIFRSRPNMQEVITRLIGGVESGKWLPEELLVWSESFFTKLTTIAEHVSYELEGECALSKIRMILQECLHEYSSKDIFDVLLLTFCNLDSDRDTLEHKALVDFFRSMVSPNQHPRAEERAFVSIFDPANTGEVSDEAFGAGIERIMHTPDDEGSPLPRQLSDLQAPMATPVATPCSRLSGFVFPPLMERGSAPTPPDRELSHHSAVVEFDEEDEESENSRTQSHGKDDDLSRAGASEEVAIDIDPELPPKMVASAHVVFADPALIKKNSLLSMWSPSAENSALRSARVLPPGAVNFDFASEDWLRGGTSFCHEVDPAHARQRVRRCSSSLDCKPNETALTVASNAPSSAQLHVDASGHGRAGGGGRSSGGGSFLRRSRRQSLVGGRASMGHDITTLRPDYLNQLWSCRSSAQQVAPSASFFERNPSAGQEAMRSKESRDSWQILFCGGTSSALKDAMNEVALNLGVSLRTETFDW